MERASIHPGRGTCDFPRSAPRHAQPMSRYMKELGANVSVVGCCARLRLKNRLERLSHRCWRLAIGASRQAWLRR